jgi:hypothetical protein
MPRRKCYGKAAAAYPGLTIESAVHSSIAKSCKVTVDSSEQVIVVTNSSLLTYDVSFESKCDKECLRYVMDGTPPDEDDVWSGSFTAPFRWDAAPRHSIKKSSLAVRNGKFSTDAEIDVEVTCSCEPYANIKTFSVVLQVDADGT